MSFLDIKLYNECLTNHRSKIINYIINVSQLEDNSTNCSYHYMWCCRETEWNKKKQTSTCAYFCTLWHCSAFCCQKRLLRRVSLHKSISDFREAEVHIWSMPFINLASFNRRTHGAHWAGWRRQLQLVGGSAPVSLTETIAVLITHN